MRKRFPYSDAQPSSAANIFFGGKNVEEINFDNLLPVFEILEDAEYIEEGKLDAYVLSEREAEREKKECDDIPIWKLLKNGRFEIARNKSDKLNKVFDA